MSPSFPLRDHRNHGVGRSFETSPSRLPSMTTPRMLSSQRFWNPFSVSLRTRGSHRSTRTLKHPTVNVLSMIPQDVWSRSPIVLCSSLHTIAIRQLNVSLETLFELHKSTNQRTLPAPQQSGMSPNRQRHQRAICEERDSVLQSKCQSSMCPPSPKSNRIGNPSKRRPKDLWKMRLTVVDHVMLITSLPLNTC